MSSIVVDFEVLPEGSPQEGSASDIMQELHRQLRDPASALRQGEFGKYADHASISGPGLPFDGGGDASSDVIAPPPATFPGSFPGGASWVHQPAPLDHASAHGASAHGASAHGSPGEWQATAAHALSNAELLDEIHNRERQIARTAGQDMGSRRQSVGDEAQRLLEEKCMQLHHRLEAVERELRETQEVARVDKSRLQRTELMLKDRDQLLAHAKEMWMKESARASKLADSLTRAEETLADQEKRLVEVSERYNEAQLEVRQLRHLLDGPDGAGYTGGFAGPIIVESKDFKDVPLGVARAHENCHNCANLLMADSDYCRKCGTRRRTEAIRPSVIESASPMNTTTSSERRIGSGDVALPPPPEAATNVDRFRHLCLANDAILFEDDLLQVGVKSEYSGLEGQLAVFFGNKGGAALQAFNVQFLVREERALRLTTSSLSQTLGAHDQVVQRINVTCMEPFAEAPVMRVQFLLADTSPRRIQMKLPVVLTKFMRGCEVSQQEFFRIWRTQRFQLNEVTAVVNLAARLRSALVHIARSLVFGGALRLLPGVDQNPDNFVLVGQLNERLGSDLPPDVAGVLTGSHGDRESGLSLVRVEVGTGRFLGKARIVVRSSDSTVARGVCECIMVQLSEPNLASIETR